MLSALIGTGCMRAFFFVHKLQLQRSGSILLFGSSMVSLTAPQWHWHEYFFGIMIFKRTASYERYGCTING